MDQDSMTLNGFKVPLFLIFFQNKKAYCDKFTIHTHFENEPCWYMCRTLIFPQSSGTKMDRVVLSVSCLKLHKQLRKCFCMGRF